MLVMVKRLVCLLQSRQVCVVKLSFRRCLATLWILHNVIWILTPNEMKNVS